MYCHFNNVVFTVMHAAITLEHNLPSVRMWERSDRGSSYIKERKIRVIDLSICVLPISM